MLTGRCLCGACSYEIDGDPVVVAHCHCRDCQRVSGAGHATGAMYPEASVRLNGEPAVYTLQSEAGNAVTRLFCGACGSPLFGRNSGMPGFMTLALGTADMCEAAERLTPQVAIFTRSRRHWDLIQPGVAAYEAQPGWSPGDPVP